MLENRTFSFRRHGRAYHLIIDRPEDLQWVVGLDQALWVANSASIETINADPGLLEYLDPSGDKRVHAEDVKRAVQWTLDTLADLSGIREGNTSLKLEAIGETTREGARIRRTATQILARVGDSERAAVSLEDVRSVKKVEDERGLSEAGIVLPAAAPDDEVRQFLVDILDTVGGAEHSAGETGVTADHLKRFLDEASRHVEWVDRAELVEGETSSAILPMGPATHDAYALLASLRAKLDQFFSLCYAARIDPQVADRVWAPNAVPKDLDLVDPGSLETFLVGAPLARPNPNGRLDLTGDLNPHYAEPLSHFHELVMAPLGMGDRLDPDEWAKVESAFADHRRWFESRPDVTVGDLPVERLRMYVESPRFKSAARELIDESHRTALDLDNVRLLERLILYQAWILPFVNSFVSFPTLYDPDQCALFEMGSLIMDGRHFTLAVRILDRELHKRLSTSSNVFVLFAEVTDRHGEVLYEVAVPVTSGGRGNLQVGKRGIFVDTEGHSHHAEVTHIVHNPISFREALVSPFMRMGHAITGKLEQMQSAAEDRIEKFGVGAVTRVEKATAAPAAEVAPAPVAPSTGGLLAGGGIALAALGSSGAFVLKTLAGMKAWTILGVLFGLSQAILLPILLVAWIKLRRRDLSAILEGSGWGINARMRLTRRQATTFTHRPPYPPGSVGIGHRNHWAWLLAALAVLAVAAALGWWQGWFVGT